LHWLCLLSQRIKSKEKTNMTFIPAETDFAQMVNEKIRGNHFLHYLGFIIKEIKPGLVSGELNLKPDHLQQMGFVHGGVTATVADIVAGFAAFTLVKHGQGVVTVELKVSYLNPAQGETLVAKGMVIKAGTRLHFCESEIWAGDLLVAKASLTMAVVNPEDIKK
jgi:uncharacterized protein (TIGR00369 family)